MGTNYYFRYNICKCCNRFSDIHIGKSSGGWSFSFHAPDLYIDMSTLDPKHALLDVKDFRFNITSFQEWKEVIDKYVTEYETAKIFDEYHADIPPEEFYSMVENKKDGKHHATYMKEDGKDYDEKRDFLDKEGHSFSRGEFS